MALVACPQPPLPCQRVKHAAPVTLVCGFGVSWRCDVTGNLLGSLLGVGPPGCDAELAAWSQDRGLPAWGASACLRR